MKINFLINFIFISFPVYASKCLPPPDNVHNLTDYYTINSDIVLTGKLIAIEYDEARNEKVTWSTWDKNYVFEYKNLHKGNLINTQNIIKFSHRITCDKCDIKNVDLNNELSVGNDFLVFGNWVNEKLTLNNCTSIIQVNNN